MALTSNRIALLAEAVRETSAVVEAAIEAQDLNSAAKTAERNLLSDDADTYERIRNSFVRIKGDGVDFDNQRKREAIFYRVRRLLGLPFVIFDLSVELMELVELEVGHNFG